MFMPLLAGVKSHHFACVDPSLLCQLRQSAQHLGLQYLRRMIWGAKMKCDHGK